MSPQALCMLHRRALPNMRSTPLVMFRALAPLSPASALAGGAATNGGRSQASQRWHPLPSCRRSASPRRRGAQLLAERTTCHEVVFAVCTAPSTTWGLACSLTCSSRWRTSGILRSSKIYCKPALPRAGAIVSSHARHDIVCMAFTLSTQKHKLAHASACVMAVIL